MADTVKNNVTKKSSSKETIEPGKRAPRNDKSKTVTPRKDQSKAKDKSNDENKSGNEIQKTDLGRVVDTEFENGSKEDHVKDEQSEDTWKVKSNSFTKDTVKDNTTSRTSREASKMEGTIDKKTTESRTSREASKIEGAIDKKTTESRTSREASKIEGAIDKKRKFEFPCDACAIEGVVVESTNYCPECAENICGDCVKQHKKFPATRSHGILGKASRRRGSAVTSVNGEGSSQQKLLECDNHPGKPVEMFCHHHDNVWCPVCMAVHHRSCESVEFITESSKNFTRTKECKNIKVDIRKLKKEVDAMHAKVQNGMESLVKRKEEVFNSIKAFRKRIEAKLDAMEEETMKQLNDVFEKNSDEIESDVNDCKKASMDLEEIEAAMEMKPTDTNADLNMFVYAKRATPRMVYANEVMTKVSSKLGAERIKFFVDTTLEEWLDESYQSFGHFMYKYTTENISISLEKDTEKCVVNGIANLPDGRFLLADSSNKRLKLFEKDFKYIDHMDLLNSPYGVAVLERSSAVISLPEEKVVQFANLDPRISLINSIDVGEPCRGLSSFEGEIYVVCGGLEGECQGHVRIYNMSGELTRSIERDNFGNALFTTPINVCVSNTTGIIYVTDRKRGILTIKQSGELLPVITDKALISPWGICEDDKRQVFVTGHNSDDIWQIRNGAPLGVILNAKDGVKGPLCITYIPNSSKVMFVMANCNDVTVCSPLTKLPQNDQTEAKGQDRHKQRHK